MDQALARRGGGSVSVRSCRGAGRDPSGKGGKPLLSGRTAGQLEERYAPSKQPKSTQLPFPVSIPEVPGSWRAPAALPACERPRPMRDERRQRGEGRARPQRHRRWQQQQARNKTPPVSYRVYISPTSLST